MPVLKFNVAVNIEVTEAQDRALQEGNEGEFALFEDLVKAGVPGAKSATIIDVEPA